jgi:hypothetical protein
VPRRFQIQRGVPQALTFPLQGWIRFPRLTPALLKDLLKIRAGLGEGQKWRSGLHGHVVGARDDRERLVLSRLAVSVSIKTLPRVLQFWSRWHLFPEDV